MAAAMGAIHTAATARASPPCTPLSHRGPAEILRVRIENATTAAANTPEYGELEKHSATAIPTAAAPHASNRSRAATRSAAITAGTIQA